MAGKETILQRWGFNGRPWTVQGVRSNNRNKGEGAHLPLTDSAIMIKVAPAESGILMVPEEGALR